MPSSPRQLLFLFVLMATSKNKMNVQSSVCNMQEYIHASRNWTHPCMCANADTTFSEIPSQLMQGVFSAYARCTDVWNGAPRSRPVVCTASKSDCRYKAGKKKRFHSHEPSYETGRRQFHLQHMYPLIYSILHAWVKNGSSSPTPLLHTAAPSLHGMLTLAIICLQDARSDHQGAFAHSACTACSQPQRWPEPEPTSKQWTGP